MSRPTPAHHGAGTATEIDPSRLAGWETQEGYSPFVPPPGMVAHGQVSPTNDPIPVYNFGQFNTPQQLAQQHTHTYNTVQQAHSMPYEHTYQQQRFHEPQPQSSIHFSGYQHPLNTQAMPFTPSVQSQSASPGSYQQAQTEFDNSHLFPTSLSSVFPSQNTVFVKKMEF